MERSSRVVSELLVALTGAFVGWFVRGGFDMTPHQNLLAAGVALAILTVGWAIQIVCAVRADRRAKAATKARADYEAATGGGIFGAGHKG